MMIARYYVSRRDYTGAISRFKVVVAKFQTSRHVEEALAGLIQAYLAVGFPREAQNTAAILIRKFPNSRWAAEAQDVLDSAYPEPVEGERP
jgi:outer membrane protein assembly factor BamD